MPIRFLVLNGPPSAGKTTISRYIVPKFTERGLVCISDSFAAPMKHFISVALGEKYADIKKDRADPAFGNRTPRDFLISLSEDFIKPLWGVDWFGKMLYHRSLRYAPTPDLVVCDDNGFAVELNPLGETQPILVRVSRPGYTYDGDSRSDLPNPDFTIVNGKGVPDLYKLCDELVGVIIKEEFGNGLAIRQER